MPNLRNEVKIIALQFNVKLLFSSILNYVKSYHLCVMTHLALLLLFN
jgi:hypothetical protein